MATFNLRDHWVSKFQTNPELHESQALITHEPSVIIRIARLYQAGMTDSEVYETTRRWWRAGDRVQHAQYAIAVYKSVCIEVYEVHDWCRAPFGGHTRWEFDGTVADDDIRSQPHPIQIRKTSLQTGRGESHKVSQLLTPHARYGFHPSFHLV